MGAMKYVTLLFAFISLLGAAALAAHHGGKWHSLFDGKTLDGWTANKENPNSYFVEKGNLVVRGGRSHLFYTGKVGGANFKNFELKMKVKTMDNANSGVYFHTAYQDEGWPSQGFEAQVNTSHKDPKKTGSLYAIANVYVPMEEEEPFVVRVGRMGAEVYRGKAPSTDGHWFDYDIKVVDDEITLRVNGEITAAWTQPEGYKGPNPNMAGRRIGSGTIAFQAHDPGCEVHYKDIQIKLLD